MVFKELEIQGFKSFPDKVRIRFDEGVTGVVGPNGSGKSNLSDAVRWVLGETSSRQLRAAGKMEDVIFGGTRRRGAMGFAMVRLTLDNSAHTLDIDADEAVIGRKYYRSGESEYTINGQLCRLKDIYELLLDTGIGRDGYSVIGQGRIAEIVAAKSSERREIFEEACGIAKYRYRKTRRSGVWPRRQRTSSVCGTSSTNWKPGSARWKKRARRPSAFSSSAPGGRRWKSPSGPTASTAPGRPSAVRCGTMRPLRPSMRGLTGRPEPPRPRLRRSVCRHSS